LNDSPLLVEFVPRTQLYREPETVAKTAISNELLGIGAICVGTQQRTQQLAERARFSSTVTWQ